MLLLLYNQNPFVGVAAAGAAGSVSAKVIPAFDGVAASTATGAFSSGVAFTVAGVAAATGAGALIAGDAQVPNGAAATASAGDLGIAAAVALDGASATTSAGFLSSAAVTATGVSATGAVGDLGLVEDTSPAFTGAAVAAAAGALAISTEGTLAGTAAAAAAGDLRPGGHAVLAGAAAAGAAGALYSGIVVAPPIGVAATSSAGAVGAGPAAFLGGAAAIASAGSPAVSIVDLDRLVQQAEFGDEIELYELDATAIGGDVYRFTSTALADRPVSWGGNDYSPVPVEAEGWQWTGQGPLPTPVLRVANVSLAFGAATIAFNDLMGATVTRIRTLRRFLDGESDADDTAHFDPDIYRIDRKRKQTKTVIEWELAAALDQQGVFLPRRPILRNACTHRYRVWNGTAFDYSKATCPYAGTDYFTASGASTAEAAADRCGKKLSDCKARFGSAPLPTRAFPGVARTQSAN